MNRNIHSSWSSFFKKNLNHNLIKRVKAEYKSKNIFPNQNEVFSAFFDPFKNIKVIILGQDPYHGKGQAHGLAFSVQKEIPIPPSLRNIFKELKEDLNIKAPSHGNLENWAKEGVFLLNTSLTVEEGLPGSHKKIGWQDFTDSVITHLNANKENLVFILWGTHSAKKERLIDSKKHLILKTPHPSPLSSYRGFFGSKPFSKTNSYLREKKIKEINWNLTSSTKET